MTALVTIIVPAFNSEIYIERCIGSLLAQTYKDIEIIVIDDGSRDGTVRIVENNIKKDRRIKLIKQNHCGPNRARKKGLHAASGRYVMFIDADDFIKRDAVAILVDEFKKNDVDAIRFGALRYPSEKEASPIALLKNNRSLTIAGSEVRRLLLTTHALNNLCFQIYKTSDLKNLKAFDTTVLLGEDYLVNLEFYEKDRKLLIINRPLYYYCDNPESTTRNLDGNITMSNVADRIYVSHMAIKLAQSYNNDEFCYEAIYEQLKMVRNYVNRIAKVKNCSKSAYMEKIQKILPAKYFSNIDLDKLNKYMESLSFAERAKNVKIICAIALSDYCGIWRYIIWRKMYCRILGRG